MFDKRLMGIVPGAKRHIVKNVVIQWAALLLNVALMAAVAMLLQALVLEGGREMQLWPWGAVILAAILGRYICTRLAARESFLAARDVKKRLRETIYEKLLKLGPGYVEREATAKVIQAAVEGVEQLEVYFSAYMPQFFYAMLAPLTLFVILAPLSLKVALVLLVATPLIPLSIVAVQKIAKRLLSSYWSQYAQLGDSFLENLQGLTTLKIYSADAGRHEAMNREAEHFRRVTMRVLTMQLNSISVMDLIAYGGTAVGIIVTLLEFRAGAIGFVPAFLMIMLAAEFFLPMRALGSYFHVAMNGMAASRTIFELLATEAPSWGDADSRVQGNAPIDIGLSKVSYRYGEGAPALSEVDMTLPGCGLVSIVGESGSGKSTLAKILTGSVTGYSGRITVGARDLTALSREALLNTVSYIGSNSYIFKGTIEEQLRMGCPNATEAELWAALESVQLAEFVREGGGLTFAVAERGANLSGGQRQRLALARALLHDTPVYIFDEATSSIDVESEAAIMAVLHELKRERSVLMISHRLANSVASDALYVLDKGHVVEMGTHEALRARGGVYTRLWETQYALEHALEPAPLERRAGAVPLETPPFTEEAASENRERSDWGQSERHMSAAGVLWRLMGLVKPLMPYMLLSILMGVLGFVAAIYIPVLGGQGLVQLLDGTGGAGLGTLFIVLAVCALSRGVLRYAEQMCNHYIAFKLLARIRDQVFGALRKLAPAKLEVKDRGNLISVITGDIELLEVFYAHTLSPVAIAVVMSILLTVFIGGFHPILGIIAAGSYAVIGIALPLSASRKTQALGRRVRDDVGDLNSFFLEGLRGIREVVQFGAGDKRVAGMNAQVDAMHETAYALKRASGRYAAITGVLVQLFSAVMLLCAGALYAEGAVARSGVLLSVMTLFSSFGPVIAVANLGTGLSQTIASGHRVLEILDEVPAVSEVTSGETVDFHGANAADVSFAYGDAPVLRAVNLDVPKGRIIGLVGRSGSGKSTLLKLLMRFWDADSGRICISDQDIRALNTQCLRDMESFMTQEAHLFKGTIRENLMLANPDASDAELFTACERASIHDFILGLPDGYDTAVGELGETLSGGERQRLGLARAFLHDAPILLLDEPTSNLDSLNEAIILKAIQGDRGRTTVLVSHRASTMRVADAVYQMDAGRMC